MKIAISVRETEKEKGAQSLYFQGLVAGGARPEELTLVSVGQGPTKAQGFDGVVFCGGEDVDPDFFGERKRYDNVHVNRARDEFEFRLLDQAREQRLPILGICRGIQMINVKFGGTLYQDLKSELESDIAHRQAGSRSNPTHIVTLTDPDSQLGQIIKGSCHVNSLHHQGINRRGHGLKVVAYAEDGLPEAVEEAQDYPFFLGIQWHPEEMLEHAEQRKLFEYFVAKCREKAQEKAASGHR